MHEGRPTLYRLIPGVAACPVSNLVSKGFRSRLVADAPVLATRDRIGLAGPGKADQCLSSH
jgi:hypothetical protein